LTTIGNYNYSLTSIRNTA